MTDLVTTAEVKEYLSLTSTGQDTLIGKLITRESALIEQWCARSFSTVTHTAQRVDGSGTGVQMLPDAPVQSVSSVADAGVSIPASPDGVAYGYVYDDKALYLRGGRFTRGRQNLTVTYTAGYASVPDPVKQACIEMVGLDLQQRSNLGMNSKTLAGETISYTDRGLTPSVKELLQPYRRVAPCS